MSKKHFIAITFALKSAGTPKETCLELCTVFKRINPRFDITRFLTACGF